jgi:hypothetical protein
MIIPLGSVKAARVLPQDTSGLAVRPKVGSGGIATPTGVLWFSWASIAVAVLRWLVAIHRRLVRSGCSGPLVARERDSFTFLPLRM